MVIWNLAVLLSRPDYNHTYISSLYIIPQISSISFFSVFPLCYSDLIFSVDLYSKSLILYSIISILLLSLSRGFFRYSIFQF